MSTHDDGFGRKAGSNPGSQSDFTNRPSMAGAPGMPGWGNNALNTRPSEVGLMAQGAGRPAQPVSGQRPMFGGGSPAFAQMPSYTPVTRGPDPRQQIPQPQQPVYSQYPAAPQWTGQPIPPQPNQQPPSGFGFQNPQGAYAGEFAEPGPNYQSYQASQYPGATGYNAMPNYQTADFGGQGYQQAPTNFSGAEQAGSYQASNYDGAQGFQGQPYQGQPYQGQPYQGQPYQDQSFADASFPESSAGDASFPEPSFDQNFSDPNYANQNFAKQGFADAGFQQRNLDASFPEEAFPGAQAHPDVHGGDGYGRVESQADQVFEPFAEEPARDYGGQVPKIDPRRQLQAFDAIYDQPPQIALGSTEAPRHQSQDWSERLDADFLDETQVIPPPGVTAKKGMTFKSRSAFMVGSALLGAIALGGALAFAYKQSGGGLGSEPPPVVQADNSPVKAVPDQAGGNDGAPKSKLIYDRLQSADDAEGERIVPRQEDVAVPAMPGAAPAAPMPVASTDAAPPTTQALPGIEQPIPVAAVQDPSMPDGGPRKVKTMVVRPDGSVEPAPVAAAPEGAPAEAAPAAPEAAPQAPAQQLAAAAPAAPVAAQPAAAPAATKHAAAPAPAAKPKPAAQQVAAATPQTAAAAGPTKYVVQVGSKKNQTEALASFADMQQKYPTLLANYRPIVQKADLGSKGTWYRLRIGPINDKTAASKLCTQLKAQGLADCLVTAQSQ
jgi:SPOR domain